MLQINPKNLRALSHNSSLYLLESVSEKHKLQIYRFDPLSKMLTHLYLGSLKHLLFVGIFGESLFRIYVSPDSHKLFLDNASAKPNPYLTNVDQVDFSIKFNRIRENKTFLKSTTIDFCIQSNDRETGAPNFNQMFVRQPSYHTSPPSNSLFCKSLLASPFSYANRPLNLNLKFFSPHRVNLKKSLFDPQWKHLTFFREQNCLRIIGIQPDKLQLKKWGFPQLAPDISDCVIVRDKGFRHKKIQTPKLI